MPDSQTGAPGPFDLSSSSAAGAQLARKRDPALGKQAGVRQGGLASCVLLPDPRCDAVHTMRYAALRQCYGGLWSSRSGFGECLDRGSVGRADAVAEVVGYRSAGVNAVSRAGPPGPETRWTL